MEKVYLHELLLNQAGLSEEKKIGLLNKRYKSHGIVFGNTRHREARQECTDSSPYNHEHIAIDVLLGHSRPYAVRLLFLPRWMTIVLDSGTPIPESQCGGTVQEEQAWLVANVLEVLLTPVTKPKVKEPK